MIKKILTLYRCTSIRLRIMIHFILIASVSIGATYFITYESLENEIKETYFKKLTAIREIKKTQIQEYYDSIKNDISILAISENTIKASKELSTYFMKNEYKSIVTKYDIYFKKYIDKKQFYDIFLVDIKSNNIIYTATKESDFTTNIISGKCGNTNLNKIYKNIKNSKDNIIKIVDFEHYAPSNEKPASFIGTKILDKNNKPIAVLIFQISIKKINDIMTGNKNWKNEGFGRTGECYIISDDCTMRNDSRFYMEDKKNYFKNVKQAGVNEKIIQEIKEHKTTVLHQEVKGAICDDILKGKSETKIIKDYRGVEVLSAYAPLKIDGLNWVILSEIDKAEAFGYINEIKNKILIVLIVIFILIILTTILFSKTITKPLYLLTNAVKSLGTGDLSKRVNVDYSDELGELASCFNSSIDELEKMTSSVEHFTKLSVIDNLTQIYNRLKLNHELDIEIKRSKRTKSKLSLVMFDIDHFKNINDTFGHDIGDITLIDLVKLVSENIRETDIFARWGGEEFMLLLIDTDLEHAQNMSEKIRAKIEQYKFKKIKTMTCSFGITQFYNKDTKESFIKRVDEVLYDAKHNGRNRIEIR